METFRLVRNTDQQIVCLFVGLFGSILHLDRIDCFYLLRDKHLCS